MSGGQAIRTITIGELALCVFVAACGGPAAAPTSGATAGPSPSAAPTASAAAAPATQSAAAPLTDEELASITLGSMVPIPADAPQPKVGAIDAEATVRATYTGPRQTIDVRRIARKFRDRVVTGWLIALTPEAGVPCVLHPGLLPRAIEGGIVDDQTGELLWSMICG